MNKFVILADVTSDMSAEIREYFEINDYISGYVNFGDRGEYVTRLEWDCFTREEFYKALSDKKTRISTSPASPEEYYEKIKAYAAEGYDVLSITLSSLVSSTHNVAATAVKRVQEEYPERVIYCLDSCRMSAGFGLLVAYAHILKNEGKSIAEVIDWIEENKCRVHQMGPIDDLMFVARRGRISTGKAIMGSFAGVKPMGDCNSEGYVTVLTKAKGIKKALRLTVEYVRRSAKDIENNYVFISHSNREQYALELAEMMEKELHPKRVFVTDVYSASGTNIGPGMICAYYFGEPISDDGAAEKEFMNKAAEACL